MKEVDVDDFCDSVFWPLEPREPPERWEPIEAKEMALRTLRMMDSGPTLAKTTQIKGRFMATAMIPSSNAM